MDISILGYKINLEILILIGVVYLILVSHTICGCSNYGLMEGLEMITGTSSSHPNDAASVSTTAKKPTKESFVGANTNWGESSSYDLATQTVVDTSKWNAPNMTVYAGKPLSDGVKQFLDREPQQVPLPDGEMLMFANTPFKPECCPNAYSNSQGCACMTGPQYNYLVTRGGNNVPYSDY